MKRRILSGLLAIATSLVLASAGLAEDAGGIATVLAKDEARRTLLLDTGAVLQVTPRTAIFGPEGQRLGFADLKSAEATSEGFYESDGDEGIRFEASREGDRLVATSITMLARTAD